MNFSRDDLVRFRTHDGRSMHGKVTMTKGKAVRVVDIEGRRYTTSPHGVGVRIQLKSIRPVWAGVFLFDTQLDRGCRSQRRGEVFWREYCRHAGWTFAYERVHSLSDLRYFLHDRTIKEPVLVFNGHGSSETGWQLSNRECLDADTEISVSPVNRDKVVIFSACGMGSNPTLCQSLKRKLGATDVIAYRTTIDDAIAFVAEPLLIQLLNAEYEPGKIGPLVEKVRSVLDPLKTLNERNAKKFPLVCY